VIGLDTNVLVRILTGDDETQSTRAKRFLSDKCSVDDPAFVSCVVLVETYWVLESVYGFKHSEINAALELIFSVQEIRIQDDALARQAWQSYSRGGADFADVLIEAISRAHGCEATVTFDRKAAKLDGFRLLS
jgi:predicted nucleic-acid-binding protein